MHRLRPHLSYANLVATLALFIALGGTGYATLALPKDSIGTRELRSRAVGSAELKPDAVTSSKVRDGSLDVRDLRESAQKALTGATGARGATGGPGPPGPAGAPGVSAISEWAVVNGVPNLVAGTAVSVAPSGIGQIIVRFNRSILNCGSSASIARVGGDQEPEPGRITIRHLVDGTALIRTFNAGGAPADIGFHLIVVCS